MNIDGTHEVGVDVGQNKSCLLILTFMAMSACYMYLRQNVMQANSKRYIIIIINFYKYKYRAGGLSISPISVNKTTISLYCRGFLFLINIATN